MLKNKPIVIILAVLLALSVAASSIGFVLSKKGKNSKPVDNTPKITYEYFLEEQPIVSMPENTDENGETYEFSNYVCDNNMILDFDPVTWTYKINNKTDGTCKLYFVKSNYNVEIIATNGLINEQDSSYTFEVPRLTDGQFSIIPNEGYEFDEVSCTNDKEANFDISTNMLNINSVSEDIACKINFKKRMLTLEIKVKNGTGATTEEREYGESVSAIIQANEGYEKPKIECSNKQEFTYENNNLTISKLTDNSVCSVTFSKTPAVTYNLIIDELPEQVTITSGNKKQSIISGKDGKFSLRAQDGYQIVLDCNGVKPSDSQEDADGSITYTFLGMSKNITCNIKTELIDENTNN